MAEFDFYYTLNNADLDAFRSEGIRRFEGIKKKGFDTPLTGEQMYELLYGMHGRILCVISQEGDPVGMMVLYETTSLFRATNILLIEQAHFDNIPGLLEASIEEVDRIAATEDYGVVQFCFNRPGWAKKMKMYPEKGYKVSTTIAEKKL